MRNYSQKFLNYFLYFVKENITSLSSNFSILTITHLLLLANKKYYKDIELL